MNEACQLIQVFFSFGRLFVQLSLMCYPQFIQLFINPALNRCIPFTHTHNIIQRLKIFNFHVKLSLTRLVPDNVDYENYEIEEKYIDNRYIRYAIIQQSYQ